MPTKKTVCRCCNQQNVLYSGWSRLLKKEPDICYFCGANLITGHRGFFDFIFFGIIIRGAIYLAHAFAGAMLTTLFLFLMTRFFEIPLLEVLVKYGPYSILIGSVFGLVTAEWSRRRGRLIR